MSLVTSAATGFGWEKFVDGREDDAATRALQQRTEMVAVLGLFRFLAQQLMAAGECAEKLVVQIVAVREHDQRRILHRWFKDEPSGVERHRQRFTGALRVPHDPDTLVA